MRYTKLLLSIVCCLQQHNDKIEWKFKPNLLLYQCCHVVGGRQLEVHAAFFNHTSIVLLLQRTNIWNVFSYFNVAHLREIFYLCLQYFSNTMMFKDLFSLQKILKFIDRVTTINTKICDESFVSNRNLSVALLFCNWRKWQMFMSYYFTSSIVICVLFHL